jgi:probable rRNA maturation factor
MIKIDVVSDCTLWSKKIKKNDTFFNKIIKFFPKKYKFVGKKINLTILLSDNKNIKKLNKDFRNKNKPTDILSFPFEKKFNLKKTNYIGDIVISYEFMNKPKNISVFEFQQKVIKIFIHGFLHLLGHDHIKLKDFKKMSKEEDKIYKFIQTKVVKLA